MQSFLDDFPANSGRLQFAPSVSDHVVDVVLAVDAMTRIPIPAEARFAVFSFDGDIRMKLGDAATIFALPVVTSSGGEGSELNPQARRLRQLSSAAPAAGATHICLRAPQACSGSVSFYA